MRTPGDPTGPHASTDGQHDGESASQDDLFRQLTATGNPTG